MKDDNKKLKEKQKKGLDGKMKKEELSEESLEKIAGGREFFPMIL